MRDDDSVVPFLPPNKQVLAEPDNVPRRPSSNYRRLASPDIADALALTFARPVHPRAYDDWMGTGGNVVSEYDPFEPKKTKPPRYYAPGWARLREEEGDGA